MALSAGHPRSKSPHQAPNRALLIRSVAISPSVCHSKLIEPPSCAVMLLLTNLLPKLGSPLAFRTGGPPFSVQTMTTLLSSAVHDTSRVPTAFERAPYFTEFVASS